MKRSIPVLAVCVGTALFAAGCTKTSEPPPPGVPKQAPPAQGTSSAPAVAVPPMPDANVPKGAEAAAPKPGQAGDQSSPAFKEGGKTDPHK